MLHLSLGYKKQQQQKHDMDVALHLDPQSY